jgi:hypothetical protein
MSTVSVPFDLLEGGRFRKGGLMPGLETNIFPILNLSQLSSRYRRYLIRGLQPNHPQYFQNVDTLVRDLSYNLQRPVSTIQNQNQLFLVVRDDAPKVPDHVNLIRATAYLDPLDGTFEIDYTLRSPENDELRMRFLQFMLREPLGVDRRLWSPGAGRPFFTFDPLPTGRDIDHFRGFNVRVVVTPDGGMGLCVEVANKYVKQRPLPTYLTHDEFERLKKRSCIYHYGNTWYEFRPQFLSDLNVSECLITDDEVPLLQFIRDVTRKPFPRDLAALPADASVVYYLNNKIEQRSAPAALCYPVCGPHDAEMKSLHSRSIIGPERRRDLIHRYQRDFLRNLKFKQVTLEVDSKPLSVPTRKFFIPDYKFGNDQKLSVRGTPGAQHASLDNIGRIRLSMLGRNGPGFYNDKPLDRQYLIIPRSVSDSYGGEALRGLAEVVDDLFPQEDGYVYKPIVYDDSGPRTFVAQGTAILKAIETEIDGPGYGVVMVHYIKDRDKRKEDPLAAMLMRRLRDYKIQATVMHSEFLATCYRFTRGANGEASYRVRKDKARQLSGYLRGVAINKVLLNNQRWPFVLDTKLHADLIVGIDVKNNSAGFVVVGNNGQDIRFHLDTSSQKEKLDQRQVKLILADILRKEAAARQDLIQNVVLHRDGKAFPEELAGAREAIGDVRGINGIAEDIALTTLEIQKTTPVPLRLFEVTNINGEEQTILNPQVGYYYLPNRTDGYLCATGRAFRRNGTVKPLHVRLVEGPMSIESCLEDVYALTSLAWTRPEDCTRYPITIKLNDRYLGEEAGKYDEHAFEEILAKVKGAAR